MKRSERIAGKSVPVLRAASVAEVGRLLQPGVIVEMDPATAAACGACTDDCTDWEEAFAAAEDPCQFGTEDGGHEAA